MLSPVGRSVALLCLVVVLGQALPTWGKPVAAQRGATAPNIVLILLDDLDARSIDRMPNVSALLRDRGVTFANFFATTPSCCPSRASILRGQYAHNHGVLRNTGADGGFDAFHDRGNERSTVATWLQAAGYRTVLLGKYLNGYSAGGSPARVPPGWDEWYAAAGGKYFRYTLNENGRFVSYGDRPADYSTDVFSRKTTDFVRRSAAARQPFFVYLAPWAPHSPFVPAPRHADAFAGARAPRVPSFNEADTGDKPAWVRRLPDLTGPEIRQLDESYRRRLRTLLAVDDLVANLIDTLRATGTLDNTYVFFTSDNGYFLGEHRLPSGKRAAYDESIRVPLIVRGPGVAAGRVVRHLALNTDLAPTFAELARAAAPGFVDGRSLVPFLGRDPRPTRWRQAVLIEILRSDADSEGDRRPFAPPYRAVRTADHLYVEYIAGGRELYDLNADPFQLENVVATADPELRSRLAARISQLRRCAGADCRAAEDASLDPGVTSTRPGRASRRPFAGAA